MLEAFFPIMFYIFLGYIAKVGKLFEERDSKVFIDFIIYFSFPAIVFKNIYFLEINSSLLGLVMLGWLGLFIAFGLSFIYSKVMGFDLRSTILFIILASFGNTAFVGIPYTDAFFGEEGVRYAIVFDQFVSFLAVSLIAPFLISFANKEFDFRSIMKRILLFPPFIVLFIALFARGVEIPLFAFKALDILGSTVTPLALFVVGFGLNFKEAKNSFGKVAPIIAIKLILTPLFIGMIIYLLGYYDELPYKIVIFQSAMPCMIYASILAVRGGLDRTIALSAVGISVIVSLAVFPIIYYLLDG